VKRRHGLGVAHPDEPGGQDGVPFAEPLGVLLEECMMRWELGGCWRLAKSCGLGGLPCPGLSVPAQPGWSTPGEGSSSDIPSLRRGVQLNRGRRPCLEGFGWASLTVSVVSPAGYNWVLFSHQGWGTRGEVRDPKLRGGEPVAQWCGQRQRRPGAVVDK
jgi:hypothetical protein